MNKKNEVVEKKEMKFDPYQVIRFPLSTEKCIRQVEFDNKMTFVIGPKANKGEVKRAVEELFKVKVLKVNLHHTFSGKKVAYVKLSQEKSAADISADLGLI